ncbi:MAG TPA: multicopper oxidase domain-containing protein [Gemmatimonadales bacterium]|nr:multicopper oxidase domain-containing protein [Gemmatimonadales bacterium]
MARPRGIAYPALILGPLALAALFALREVNRDTGRTHTYYIAADEVLWDYAPSGKDLVTGQAFDAVSRQYAEPGPGSIGHVARKSLYREYTDSSFTTLKPRPAELQYLGFLGPLLRASVGDTIRIVFKNKTRFPASVHPHGVFYNKDSEGAPYADGTSGADQADDGVPSGGTHVYVWPVPERAGPTEHEGNSAFWMYHSHTHETADVNAGLTGAMIITRRGGARADGTPSDVDREIVIAFAEVDENESPYLMENLKAYATRPDSVKIDTVFGVPQVRQYAQYNFRETLNGYIYGNLPMPTMRVGERTRWYIMASTNFEMHAPHWHGNVVDLHNMRTDVASITPMEMVVADMVPDNPGVWLFHCHLGNHLLMGMQGRYEVQPMAVARR